MNLRPQYAYTGPTPATGQVGFVNVQMSEDGKSYRFTVRKEGDYSAPVHCDVPLAQAQNILRDALNFGDAPRP
jgi:hypothetical protein